MVDFVNIFVRSSRRLRLEFSSALASGAFVATWYSLVCDDSSTGDPAVVAAMMVPGLANYVELAVDRDVADGAQYTLTVAAGVPAADASTAPLTTQLFNVPNRSQAPSQSVSAKDISDIIFQEDIAHDLTTGHALAPDGDLGSVTGPENVKANGGRGLVSEGLLHRAGWGAKLREHVDAPDVLLPQLRGIVERQLRRDDRITAARGAVVDDPATGERVVVADIELVGQVKTNIRRSVNARR